MAFDRREIIDATPGLLPPGGRLPPRGRALTVVSALAALIFLVAQWAARHHTPAPDAAMLAAEAVAAPALLSPVSQADALASFAPMDLAPQDAARLEGDIKAGRLTMMLLSPVDGETADGSAISLHSGGLSRFVILSPVPARILLPAPRDGLIRMTGEIDMRHTGIRVGYWTHGKRVALPPLAVGQSILIPVRPATP